MLQCDGCTLVNRIFVKGDQLMKKLIASAVVAVVFSMFSPMAPLAHAQTIQEQLTQALAQDANVARVQQMLAVKKQLAQGKNSELLTTLANAALSQASQGETANLAGAVAQGDIKQVLENTLRQQVTQGMNDKIAPYEKELGILAALLNKQSLAVTRTPDTKALPGAPSNYKRILDMTATAYAPGPLDNGKWNNQTYVGGIVQHGVAAVDPNVIPMGTKLWVEGYGEAIANDQGSAIKGNRIDLAFNNRSEALAYGIQKVKIYVLT